MTLLVQDLRVVVRQAHNEAEAVDKPAINVRVEAHLCPVPCNVRIKQSIYTPWQAQC
jgi:hypothetical protein